MTLSQADWAAVFSGDGLGPEGLALAVRLGPVLLPFVEELERRGKSEDEIRSLLSVLVASVTARRRMLFASRRAARRKVKAPVYVHSGPNPGCWCCVCKHSRLRSKEGCAACWADNAVQAWIDGWAMGHQVEEGVWVSRVRQDNKHAPKREFGCPPVGESQCPGFTPRLQIARAAGQVTTTRGSILTSEDIY